MASRFEIEIDGRMCLLSDDDVVKNIIDLTGTIRKTQSDLLAFRVKLGSLLLQISKLAGAVRYYDFLKRAGLHTKTAYKATVLASKIAGDCGEVDLDKLLSLIRAWNNQHPNDPISTSEINLRKAEIAAGLRSESPNRRHQSEVPGTSNVWNTQTNQSSISRSLLGPEEASQRPAVAPTDQSDEGLDDGDDDIDPYDQEDVTQEELDALGPRITGPVNVWDDEQEAKAPGAVESVQMALSPASTPTPSPTSPSSFTPTAIKTVTPAAQPMRQLTLESLYGQAQRIRASVERVTENGQEISKVPSAQLDALLNRIDELERKGQA